MSRLAWDRLLDRTYESGIDRMVLYTKPNQGFAWSGIIAIDTSFVNHGIEDNYLDGQKYSTTISHPDYQARIRAYSSPREFYECEGLYTIAPGFYATHQPRMPFNFCYRTLIGDNVSTDSVGYKLHLIYNALAFPVARQHQTGTNVVTPVVREWNIYTIPYHEREFTWFLPDSDRQLVHKKTAFVPGSYFAIDSRSISPKKLTTLESLLYGTETIDPQIPSPAELIEIIR